MNIYGYHREGYNGEAVKIQVVSSASPLNILSHSSFQNRQFREKARILFNQMGQGQPTGTVQLDKNIPLMDVELAILLALLLEKNHLKNSSCPDMLLQGSVNLDGTLSTRPGPLDSSKVAREADCHVLITSSCIETEQEASSPKIEYVTTLEAAFSLASKFAILNQGLGPKPILEKPPASLLTDPFFGVIGLQNVRGALALAAAGRLNILLFGPPGAGKTMMLQRLHLLLPPLSRKERQEIMQISGCKVQQIPQFELRSEMKEKDLVGGEPPQICQAHNGILVIDEIPGFKPSTLRAIQALLDQKKCKGFPCDFFVAAAMNACPCGNLGVPEGICTCSKMQISAYWRKVGYPLLDRFDLLVPVKNENLLVSNLIPTKENLTEKIQEVRLLCLDRQEEDYRRLLPLFNRCNPRKDISLRSALSVCRTAFLIANFKGKDFVVQQDMREALLYKTYGSAKPYWQPL